MDPLPSKPKETVFTKAYAYIANFAHDPSTTEKDGRNLTRLPARTSSRQNRSSHVSNSSFSSSTSGPVMGALPCHARENIERQVERLEIASQLGGNKLHGKGDRFRDLAENGTRPLKIEYLDKGWEFGKMVCVMKGEEWDFREARQEDFVALQEDEADLEPRGRYEMRGEVDPYRWTPPNRDDVDGTGSKEGEVARFPEFEEAMTVQDANLVYEAAEPQSPRTKVGEIQAHDVSVPAPFSFGSYQWDPKSPSEKPEKYQGPARENWKTGPPLSPLAECKGEYVKRNFRPSIARISGAASGKYKLYYWESRQSLVDEDEDSEVELEFDMEAKTSSASERPGAENPEERHMRISSRSECPTQSGKSPTTITSFTQSSATPVKSLHSPTSSHSSTATEPSTPTLSISPISAVSTAPTQMSRKDSDSIVEKKKSSSIAETVGDKIWSSDGESVEISRSFSAIEDGVEKGSIRQKRKGEKRRVLKRMASKVFRKGG